MTAYALFDDKGAIQNVIEWDGQALYPLVKSWVLSPFVLAEVAMWNAAYALQVTAVAEVQVDGA